MLIDWSRTFEWLDKEIEKIIVRGGRQKGKRADLLARVWLKDGASCVLLLHIEIQSEKDDSLPARIHLYWSGLHFNTREQVISLVILADLDPLWRPKRSVIQIANFKSEIQFETCKLLDLNLDDPSVRGIPYEVARAQIAALRTRNNPAARYRAKKELLLNLYQCGYTADDIREVYGMIDHMMLLSASYVSLLNQEIRDFEQSIAMPFITSMEKEGLEKGIEKGLEKGIEKGIEKGLVKGREEGREEVARRMIAAGKPDQEIADMTGLSLETIGKLRDKIKESGKSR